MEDVTVKQLLEERGEDVHDFARDLLRVIGIRKESLDEHVDALARRLTDEES